MWFSTWQKLYAATFWHQNTSFVFTAPIGIVKITTVCFGKFAETFQCFATCSFLCSTESKSVGKRKSSCQGEERISGPGWVSGGCGVGVTFVQTLSDSSFAENIETSYLLTRCRKEPNFNVNYQLTTIRCHLLRQQVPCKWQNVAWHRSSGSCTWTLLALWFSFVISNNSNHFCFRNTRLFRIQLVDNGLCFLLSLKHYCDFQLGAVI